jgi:hypothetical protein
MKCAVCGKGITARFVLCSGCLEKYGDRSQWPPWLTFMVADEGSQRYRARKDRAEVVVTEADLAADVLMDEMDELGSDLTVLDALSTVRLVELFRDAKLTHRQICAVVLKIYAEFTEPMMVATGAWPSQQAVSDCWRKGLAKMRAVLEKEALMDKYTVRVAVALSWQGIDVADRPAAQAVAEELTRRLIAGAVEAPEGVSLRQDDLAISTTSIQGPSHPRRPMMAHDLYATPGVEFGSRQPIDLGVAR